MVRALAILAGLRPLEGDAAWWSWGVILPLWWCLLLVLALAFAGQNVKFVYIDF